MSHKVVLIRHGQSVWNKENRFTGWKDVELSEQGVEEAKQAGLLLKKENFQFDVAYTSVLQRAIKTLWLVLEQSDQLWIPVHKCWRLNERHYGQLTGLNKKETAEKHGDEQVRVWRRSYATPPPVMESNDSEHPKNDQKYAEVPVELLPGGEALLQTKERVLPFWLETIAPSIQAGKKVIIAAHGNSIRALVQHLEDLNEEQIMEVEIPTGVPLVYELDDQLKPIGKEFLGDQATIKAAMHDVAQQGSAK